MAHEIKQHELKCWPNYFDDVMTGGKPFEVRRDDRGFAVGDILWLREWKPGGAGYTGRSVKKVIIYRFSSDDDVLADRPLFDGWCVLGLAPLPASFYDERVRAPGAP